MMAKIAYTQDSVKVMLIDYKEIITELVENGM